MDSVKPSSIAPAKNKLARTVSKFLSFRSFIGIAPADSDQKPKLPEKIHHVHRSSGKNETRPRNADASEAILAKLFAGISAIKAAYAQLQFFQFPYDADGIQSADQLVVSELKKMSDLKQSYVKKQLDPSAAVHDPAAAEIQEHKNQAVIYKILIKKLESQLRFKDCEINHLNDMLDDLNKQNRALERKLRLIRSSQISVSETLDWLSFGLDRFGILLRRAAGSMRSFSGIMMAEMRSAGWDLSAAANSIAADVLYWREEDKRYAFESFLCSRIFDGFNSPFFSIEKAFLLGSETSFMKIFADLEFSDPTEYLLRLPDSVFAVFCHVKYLQLIHPHMESSFFGNFEHRRSIIAGKFPATAFFDLFLEMAKWVWLLHCLSFGLEPRASIFQASRGSRFSEVYMECVPEESALLSPETPPDSDPVVAFMVFPGFLIGKTVLQCKVYLSLEP